MTRKGSYFDRWNVLLQAELVRKRQNYAIYQDIEEIHKAYKILHNKGFTLLNSSVNAHCRRNGQNIGT